LVAVGESVIASAVWDGVIDGRLFHPTSQLRPRLHSQFAERFVQVVLDGARADEQLRGDLSVRASLRYQA
jgi:hypothetical protein